MVFSPIIRLKFREWFRRYFPAEVAATVGALVGAVVGYLLTKSPILTAVAGTWGENLFYYGFIAAREYLAEARVLNGYHQIGRLRKGAKIFRNLALEFGPAEFLDSFLVRPFWMWVLPLLTGSLMLGIFLGKLLADASFYLLTVLAYEWRKKYFKE